MRVECLEARLADSQMAESAGPSILVVGLLTSLTRKRVISVCPSVYRLVSVVAVVMGVF